VGFLFLKIEAICHSLNLGFLMTSTICGRVCLFLRVRNVEAWETRTGSSMVPRRTAAPSCFLLEKMLR
jgi:hypothetical protein